MTTDMKTAIQKAGITLPVNRRIWMWLKDHPKSTGAQIAAVLKVPDNNVATLCKDMLDRGMVLREFEQRRGKVGMGWALRDVALYTVNPKMEQYELWSKPAKPLPLPKAPQKDMPKVAPTPVPAVMLEPGEFRVAPPWSAENFVQTITLRQARDLHNYLNEIFNPKEK